MSIDSFLWLLQQRDQCRARLVTAKGDLARARGILEDEEKRLEEIEAMIRNEQGRGAVNTSPS